VSVSAPLPRAIQRPLALENGEALGLGTRWEGGQYCAILTRAGVVGCGIFDLNVAAEFGMAIALARGTPARPLVEPEDLLEARIVEVSPKAAALGVEPGMTGREAANRMLASASRG
jgi:uncharacterized protein YunC (DUF1805 family)